MACCGRKFVNRPVVTKVNSEVKVPINYNSLTGIKATSYSVPTQTSYSKTTQGTDKIICSKCATEMKIKSIYVNANNEKKANVYCPQCQLVRIVSI